jgi:hypothetical protein
MRFYLSAVAAFAIAFLLPLTVYAGQPEAREVARMNNCTPKKIDVYSNAVGGGAKTIYQVTCTLPKTTDKAASGGPDALLIACDQSLCDMLRPITLDKK